MEYELMQAVNLVLFTFVRFPPKHWVMCTERLRSIVEAQVLFIKRSV